MMTPGGYQVQEMYEMDGLAVTIPAAHHPIHSGPSSGATAVQLTPVYPVMEMYPSPHHTGTPSTYSTVVYTSQPQQLPPGTTLAPASPAITMYQQQQPQGQPVLIYDTSVHSFENRSVKMNFIRKVLVVLFTQIGICFLVINLFNTR